MCLRRLRLCGVILPALLVSCAAEPLPSPGWREEAPELLTLSSGRGPLQAGAARVSLDPPFASPMAGYIGASWFQLRELRDPLFVRAVVLDQGGRRFAFVSLDRVLIPPDFRAAVEMRPEVKRAGLSGWIVAGTHAHTAPGCFLDAWPAELLGVGSHDPLLFDHLVDRTAKALAEAAANLSLVRVEAGNARLLEPSASWVSFNRRQVDAPSDPQIDVLRLKAGATSDVASGAASRNGSAGLESDRTVATITRFAAHPTLIPFYLRRASGDFPGICCRALEASDGGVAIFAPGPCADLAAGNAADFAPAGWERRVERIGRRLAREALNLKLEPVSTDASIAFCHLALRIKLPPREAWPVPFVGRDIASYYPDHAILQCVRLGDVLIVTFPGEMSSELGERIRSKGLERTKARNVILWTLADHYMGYAFTRESLEKGGKSQHLSAYGPELGDLLEARMGELLVRTWKAGQPNAPGGTAGQESEKSDHEKKSEP